MTLSSKGMTFLNYPFDRSLPKATLFTPLLAPLFEVSDYVLIS